jgi:hypothetical protein
MGDVFASIVSRSQHSVVPRHFDLYAHVASPAHFGSDIERREHNGCSVAFV